MGTYVRVRQRLRLHTAPPRARLGQSTLALSAATELDFVSLPDALELVLLLVEDPAASGARRCAGTPATATRSATSGSRKRMRCSRAWRASTDGGRRSRRRRSRPSFTGEGSSARARRSCAGPMARPLLLILGRRAPIERACPSPHAPPNACWRAEQCSPASSPELRPSSQASSPAASCCARSSAGCARRRPSSRTSTSTPSWRGRSRRPAGR